MLRVWIGPFCLLYERPRPDIDDLVVTHVPAEFPHQGVIIPSGTFNVIPFFTNGGNYFAGFGGATITGPSFPSL
jgi:hypothetical protein